MRINKFNLIIAVLIIIGFLVLALNIGFMVIRLLFRSGLIVILPLLLFWWWDRSKKQQHSLQNRQQNNSGLDPHNEIKADFTVEDDEKKDKE